MHCEDGIPIARLSKPLSPTNAFRASRAPVQKSRAKPRNSPKNPARSGAAAVDGGTKTTEDNSHALSERSGLNDDRMLNRTGCTTTQTFFDEKPEHERGLLWDDVIEAKAKCGLAVVPPDIYKSLAFQKLQMLNFCIICRDESAYFTLGT